MGFMPRLPQTAPFSPSQRAWLDGYLAGLFSLPAESGGPPVPATGSPAPVGSESFPWHDPVLSLDERLALAQGQPRARRLMAAMAQLDCGQCGYLCHSYAEAIADGSEASLTRCAPGGKATARKLKELVSGSAAPAVAAAPMPATGGASPVPIEASFCAALPLNRAGSDRDTRQIVLATNGAQFEPGDSLGVAAPNAPELVAAIIARLDAKAEAPVPGPDGEQPLAEALGTACEIRRPSDRAIEVLASRATDRSQSVVLQAMAEGYPGAGPEDADLLDLLDAFPSARPPVAELVAALDPLQPRLYSIASSPHYADREIHLTVAAVRYEKRARRRFGVASTFLSDRLRPGEAVKAFIRPSSQFRLPASPDTAIVMIGPGTGVAPFRAFLQERRAAAARGRNWLIFGNPHREFDFLYEAELLAWRQDGLLTRLDTAFSRDQPEKLYVQHRLLENAALFWAWLQEGAHLYLCGDAGRMARDVETGLLYIIGREGGMEPAAAKAWLARLAADGRYRKDVY